MSDQARGAFDVRIVRISGANEAFGRMLIDGPLPGWTLLRHRSVFRRDPD